MERGGSTIIRRKTIELSAADRLTDSERRLLFATARSHLPAAWHARIVDLTKKEIDWQHLSAVAERHGVLPLMHSTLRSVCSLVVPDAAMEELARRSLLNGQRSLLFTTQLVELAKTFRSKGIPVLAFKGPVMATVAHRDIGLRHFNDLDILVHRKDMAAAEETLRALGFEKKFGGETYVESYHNGFMRADGRVFVELHWRLEFINDRHLESLWERQAAVRIFGVPVDTFSLLDQFVLTCQHGAKHRWVRLSWLSDLCGLIERFPESDWDALFRRAKELSLDRQLRMALVLALRLFEVSLPPAVLQRLESDRLANSMADQVCEYLFADELPNEAYYQHWNYRIQLLDRGLDRLRLRLKYLNWAIFTNDTRHRPLPVLSRLCEVGRRYSRNPHFVRHFLRNVFWR